jgi:hypothetical protein
MFAATGRSCWLEGLVQGEVHAAAQSAMREGSPGGPPTAREVLVVRAALVGRERPWFGRANVVGSYHRCWTVA